MVGLRTGVWERYGGYGLEGGCGADKGAEDTRELGDNHGARSVDDASISVDIGAVSLEVRH